MNSRISLFVKKKIEVHMEGECWIRETTVLKRSGIPTPDAGNR